MAKPLLDALDVKILELLQVDGRMPFTKIAKEVSVSEATVRALVNRLTRSRMVKFVTDIDPNDLGLVYVYVGVRIQGPAMQRAIEVIKQIPEIIYIVVCTGTFDAMCEIVCRNNDDLMRLLQEVRKTPGVSRVETMTVLKIEKDEWRYTALTVEPAEPQYRYAKIDPRKR